MTRHVGKRIDVGKIQLFNFLPESMPAMATDATETVAPKKCTHKYVMIYVYIVYDTYIYIDVYINNMCDV